MIVFLLQLHKDKDKDKEKLAVAVMIQSRVWFVFTKKMIKEKMKRKKNVIKDKDTTFLSGSPERRKEAQSGVEVLKISLGMPKRMVEFREGERGAVLSELVAVVERIDDLVGEDAMGSATPSVDQKNTKDDGRHDQDDQHTQRRPEEPSLVIDRFVVGVDLWCY